MTAIPTTNTHAPAHNAAHDAMLHDIGTKWSKFSKQELTDLKTNEQLVTSVVAKYGTDKNTAQREVDALMKGRHLKV
jgi:hypothetical protein